MNLGSAGVDQALFDAIVQISSEAVWVRHFTDSHAYWRASEANRQKFQLPQFGTEPDFWIRHLHPDDRERALQGFQAAAANPAIEIYEHEYRFRGKDGYYVIHDRMHFFRDAAGAATRVVGVWTDLTDQRYRDQKLNELLNKLEAERDQFQIISKLTNSAMWRVDVGSDRIYWTAGKDTLALFGLDKPDFCVDDWKHSLHPEDRDRVANHFDAVVASGDIIYKDEYRFIKKDGTVAYMVDQGYVVRDANGNALQMLGGWIDVTAEHEREDALKKLLEQQRHLNEMLSSREEELASSEEELRQTNEHLTHHLEALSEQEFLMRQSQQLAHIGSWEFDLRDKAFRWSPELYEILGVDAHFPVNDTNEVASLFDGNDRLVAKDIFTKIQQARNLPFDVVLGVRIPVGYKKWLRITGHQFTEGDRPRVLGLVYDVTLFKESEERLRASEEKFSKIFNSNPDLMTMSLEENQVVVDVNDRIEPMLGYTKQDVMGKTTREIGIYLNEEDRNRYLGEYLAHGRAQMECSWTRKDGTLIQVLLSSVRLELGGHKYILSVIKDITARKLAEERFQKGFDLSPDLMLIFREKDNVLIEANSKLESLSYYRREEVLGKRADDFRLWINPEERAKHLEEYQQHGHAFKEALLRKNGGEVFYGAVSTTRIPMAGEDHMLVVVRDITDAKLAEDQLLQSEANLTATINNTSLMVWSVDRKFRIMTANEPFKNYVKEVYGLEVRVGRNILPTDSDNPLFTELYTTWTELYKNALKGQTMKQATQRGDRYFEYSLSPIVERGAITGVSIFAEDITDRTLRERELAAANKQIGELRLMALRSVMNPHFIFNALNSIQYFIARNDRKNAINYLSTFSKLIRGVLTHSVNNLVSLADELEMLRHYVDLEQLRFENKFTFQLQVDPSVDTESIEVPSLLIQPYVENAILHGLYNKTGNGHLQIDVVQEPGYVLFSISDDGIGREAALKLKEQNFPRHRSMGTVLTEERLKLINRQENVHLEIVDNYKADGESAGTTVKIRVKIE